MGRSDRRGISRSGGLNRTTLISKALSRLLRHQAQAENIPITAEGWVCVDHLLTWNGLSSKSKFNPAVTQEEIFQIVEDNDKKRFALKHSKEKLKSDSEGSPGIEENVELVTEGMQETSLENSQPEITNENSTEKAIEIFRLREDQDPSHFFIRAAQGHSMKEIETEGLLIPITLEEPRSIPQTVVHGTFYGAWSSILQDGGLKRMNRNMIHFATGPTLSEILPNQDLNGEIKIMEVMNENKVISGMRNDAQILIYIDVERCLQDIKANSLDMKWWRSENGVILTEGVETQPDGSTAQESESSKQDEKLKEEVKRKAAGKEGKQSEKLVPTKYWNVVVEVKAGLGVLWKRDTGLIKELPAHLRDKGMPRGKGRGFRGSGRGKK